MRVFNFAAGPSTLPLPVLEQAQKELLDFFDMVSLIITNTMDDLHVDCMPDEKAYVIKDDPVEAINHPIVTFKVNSREHINEYLFFRLSMKNDLSHERE